MNDLEALARTLMAPGKGILAADESTGSIKRRFAAVGIESTAETRRAFRDLLFTTRGIEEFISGVMLFDETIRQATGDGTPFVGVLAERGMIPGIKVDAGTRPLAPLSTGTFLPPLGLRGHVTAISQVPSAAMRTSRTRMFAPVIRWSPTCAITCSRT